MLAGALPGGGASAAERDQYVAGGPRPVRHSGHTAPAAGAKAAGPLAATDGAAIRERWGIQVESLRLTASGYMLDFRYRVLDARKAAPLFERKTKPVLRDDATGVQMAVPVPPKTGALRSSNDPKAGRRYFMFFANPARFIKAGNTVTVTIGAFSVSGIPVRTDSEGTGQ